ncbi:histidine kinase [Stieleria sp. TO1_6]|uniref:histidine kinase n=1 Tax=Stieleria tagensis TaxID=2956795 RepID=UPI00209BA726|nr:histidine kinase [Stieleria tagensis]MCO8123761.1 histidine kinase [Stieleria tagensis]
MDTTDQTAAPAVVFLSGDLMFASRVRAAADAEGLQFHLAGKLPEIDNIVWVIVDLATRSGAVDGLMQQCQQFAPAARVIAYGPHVQVARLEKAKQAGIPVVVTRGQFDRSLGSLFTSQPQ